MSWDDEDDKKNRGPQDGQYVSTDEGYELDYFIETYLKKRNYPLSDHNKSIVRKKIEEYKKAHKPPIKRADLENYLDQAL